jgi:arylsulfatase
MDSRPNFVIFMTDQQRGDCTSIDGHPVLLTPNMDSIAGAGARFRHAYCSAPSCIAARRSLLSGQFPASHGMVGYKDGVEWDAPPTLPGVLKAAGYHTYWVGRSMHQHPARKRFGFDHVVNGDDWLPQTDYEEWLAHVAPNVNGSFFGAGPMHNDWTARPWHLEEWLHPTNWTIMEALRFLRLRDPSCPFLLVVSFVAPHPPLVPPAFYMERYLRMELPPPVIGDWATPPEAGGVGDDVAPLKVLLRGEALRSCRAAYYGLINHVDDQMRRIINPVDGVDALTGNNTVVVHTTDHGEMLGDHYLWRKSVPYEPSARIPLHIRAPERFGLKRRLAIDEAVCLEDIMPTLLELAGEKIPETVEGRSLVPLLRGEDVSWRPYIHIEHAPIHQSLTDGKEKFIWFVGDGREQFFDLARDPLECHDLIRSAEMAGRVSMWRERLIAELKGRPEGFTDGKRLIPGRPYPPVLKK